MARKARKTEVVVDLEQIEAMNAADDTSQAVPFDDDADADNQLVNIQTLAGAPMAENVRLAVARNDAGALADEYGCRMEIVTAEGEHIGYVDPQSRIEAVEQVEMMSDDVESTVTPEYETSVAHVPVPAEVEDVVEPMVLNGGADDCERAAYEPAGVSGAASSDQPVTEAPAGPTDSVADVLTRLEALRESGEPEIELALLDDTIAVLKDLASGRKGRKAAAPKVERHGVEGGRTAKKEEPEGKTLDVIRLAMRECGVTPSELIKLTGWTKAPWKWNFHNPKGTGWAQRYGYEFTCIKDGREARYYLTKPEAGPMAAAAD